MHIGILILAFISKATTFVIPSVPKMIVDSPVIVRGEVLSVTSSWSEEPGSGRTIFTFAEVDIVEVLRGKVGEKKIKAREKGGEVDGVGLVVPGAATFRAGELVVLFLRPTKLPDVFDVNSLMLGKAVIDSNQTREGEVLLGGVFSDFSHTTSGVPQPQKKIWKYTEFQEVVATIEKTGKPPESEVDQAPPRIITAEDLPPQPGNEKKLTAETQSPRAPVKTIPFLWLSIGIAIFLGCWFLLKKRKH